MKQVENLDSKQQENAAENSNNNAINHNILESQAPNHLKIPALVRELKDQSQQNNVIVYNFQNRI